LAPATQPADDLVALAQVLSARQIERRGHLVGLEASKREETWKSLQNRPSPAIGAPPEREEQDWHWWWAHNAKGNWHAARWHLDRLLRAEPENASLLARRSVALARLREWDAAARDYRRSRERKGQERGRWCQYAWRSWLGGRPDLCWEVCADLLRDAALSPRR
jgi:hypothetical protein